jgi:NADH-quinone oxidoreductase subunit K
VFVLHLTVAAAESAIGTSVVLFRSRATIDVEDLDTLKG